MKFGKIRVKIHFYRKNMKIRGIKLWEIIPMNTGNAFLCINEFSNQGNILRINISHVSMVMESAFDNYTFTDGTPFGIKEQN